MYKNKSKGQGLLEFGLLLVLVSVVVVVVVAKLGPAIGNIFSSAKDGIVNLKGNDSGGGAPADNSPCVPPGPGWVNFGGVCRKADYSTKPSQDNIYDWDWQSNRWKSDDEWAVCPSGSVRENNGHCYVTPACPTGWSMDDGTCEKPH